MCYRLDGKLKKSAPNGVRNGVRGRHTFPSVHFSPTFANRIEQDWESHHRSLLAEMKSESAIARSAGDAREPIEKSARRVAALAGCHFAAAHPFSRPASEMKSAGRRSGGSPAVAGGAIWIAEKTSTRITRGSLGDRCGELVEPPVLPSHQSRISNNQKESLAQLPAGPAIRTLLARLRRPHGAGIG